MPSPLVTIIIPAYCPTYLEEAIQSVETQTFRDWELIVVDDDSPSPNVRSICDRHPAAKYIWKRNGGPGEARNFGVQAARGELIAFLDDDDLWFPEKLEKQIACFRSCAEPESVGIIYTGQHQIIDGKLVGGKIDLAHGSVYEYLLFANFIGTCSSVLIPRRVFEDVGLFDKDLICAQDFDLYLRIARQYQVHAIDGLLIGYRSRPGQITKDPSLNNRDEWEILRRNKPYISRSLYLRVARFHRNLAAKRLKECAYRMLFDEGKGLAYIALLARSVAAGRQFPSLPSLAYAVLALLPGGVTEAFVSLRERGSTSEVHRSVQRQYVADDYYIWGGFERGAVSLENRS
jgi:glycosyltransferase involved in cell wall biosynthesis